MITRVRIEGEAETSEKLEAEFNLVARALADVFLQYQVYTFPQHVLLERCDGDPDISVMGNWKGRSVLHFDTQRLNDQLVGRVDEGGP